VRAGTHTPRLGLGLLMIYWFCMSMVLLNWCPPGASPCPLAPAGGAAHNTTHAADALWCACSLVAIMADACIKVNQVSASPSSRVTLLARSLAVLLPAGLGRPLLLVTMRLKALGCLGRTACKYNTSCLFHSSEPLNPVLSAPSP